MKYTTQGGNANKAGKLFEANIKGHFVDRGFIFVEPSEVLRGLANGDDLLLFGDKWYSTQLACERNLYQAKFKADVFVFEKEHWPNGLIIECKYQELGGSVDEKYVFTVMSLKELKHRDTLLILGGNGARNCAVNWMKDQQDKKGQFRFFGGSEQFYNWLHKLLK